MWILPETRAGDALIVASVVVRLRYFYVVTFCLNVICAGAYLSCIVPFIVYSHFLNGVPQC